MLPKILLPKILGQTLLFLIYCFSISIVLLGLLFFLKFNSKSFNVSVT